MQAASLYTSISSVGSDGDGGGVGGDGGGVGGDGGGEGDDPGGEGGKGSGGGSGAGCTIIPEVPTLSVDCITPTTE